VDELAFEFLARPVKIVEGARNSNANSSFTHIGEMLTSLNRNIIYIYYTPHVAILLIKLITEPSLV